MIKKILILTSRENFVWHSMQEIIPYIEESWLSSLEGEATITTLNIDNTKLSNITKSLLDADKVVITCFNYKIAKILKYARFDLKLNVSFVIYVHNMATIAFWPFRKFISSDFFNSTDVFISSCYNDKRTILAIFKKPIVYVLPFYSSEYLNHNFKAKTASINSFLFVGRISPQKNLHNLILAYSLLKKRILSKIPKLEIYGKEDNLGSPNMNVQNLEYLNFLKNLCSHLNLKDYVVFKGHVERSTLDSIFNEENNIFVSPSLHSDENFGMAALQSVLSGNKAILSDWGGHTDFKKNFPKQVELIPVQNSEFGPNISVEEIVLALNRGLNLKPNFGPLSIKYTKKYTSTCLRSILKIKDSNIKLLYSDLAENIFKARFLFEKNPTQIFSDFSDSKFIELSNFYIGTQNNNSESVDRLQYYAVPWVSFSSNIFQINDPHKGNLNIEIKSVEENYEELKYSILIDSKTTIFVDNLTIKTLLRNSFVY